MTEVDAAVRAVLADRKGQAIARHESTGRRAIGRPESDCLFIAERLISVRRLESLPTDIRVFQIGPGTVVTPLAALLLKLQGITIKRRPITVCSGSRGDGPALGESRWAIAVDSDLETDQAWRRALLEDSSPWRSIRRSMKARWLLEEAGRGGMWVTPGPRGRQPLWLEQDSDPTPSASA